MGARRASLRIIGSIQNKEEGKGESEKVALISGYKTKVETELTLTLTLTLALTLTVILTLTLTLTLTLSWSQEASGVVHAQVVANGQFGWLAFGHENPGGGHNGMDGQP